MQNSSIVTRCPQCQTAFRVNHAQLNVAKGAVRCGSCLNIFKALDHADVKVKPKTTATTKKSVAAKKGAVAAKKPSIKKPKPNKFSFDVDDELVQDNESIDNELDQDNDDFYFYDKETPPASKNTSIFGTTASTKPITETTQEKADESWALDILAELEDDDEITSFSLPKGKKTNNQSDPIKKPKEPMASGENIVSLHKTPPLDDSAASVDTAIPYEGIIDEDIQIDTQAIEKQAQKEVESLSTNINPDDDLEFYFDESFEANNEDSHLDSFNKPQDENFEENLESLISDEQISDAMESTPSYKEELQGMIKGIQSAPVEMGAYESEERRKWLWRIALLLGAILLIAQVIYFRFDSLGKNPSYRPLLTQACHVIGCKMPELIDLEQIRSNNLIVRSHPTAANALLVDVILINNANFEQPYPALSLEFSNLGDTLLAASQIQPRQYLRGELAGSKLMPAKQPIQVSLSIEDPGSDAVNYRLNILTATQ